MSALRDYWNLGKATAEAGYKARTKKSLPIKFNKGLGPALDDLTKAHGANKSADVTKYSKKAQEAIRNYQDQINAKANDLGAEGKALLTRLARLAADAK
jgi:hypothetical protein